MKKPPSNAGDVGSIPGQGTKLPHAAGHLSPQATAREAGAWQPLSPLPGREKPLLLN